MKILIEQTLFINCFQNLLILNLTSLFVKQKIKFCFLISLLGAIFSLFLPIFNLSVLSKILLLLLVALIIVCLSFKFNSFSKFAFIFLSFFIFTFLFGGACFAIEQNIGQFPLFIVCVISAVVYSIVKFIIYYHNKILRIKTFTYKVILKANGKEIVETGYLDSGNILIDNLTNTPIVLINFDVFKRLYENISFINLITKNINAGKDVNCGHYVGVNSIGSGKKILVFLGDELILNDNQVFKNPAIGLSFSGFEKSFNANVLLNSQMVFGG